MKTFTLRIADELARALDARAGELGISRTKLIQDVLSEYLGSPDEILGVWPVKWTDSEICADCDGPLGAIAWVGATKSGRLFGPLCEACASQD